MVRRQGRGLGTCALLAGRRHRPGLDLEDAPLKAKVKRYVDHIVAAQRPDGWYAPYPLDASAKPYDLWAILLANKALAQYHEATGDPAVLQAVLRNLRAVLAALDRTPLFDWGRLRWFEGLDPTCYASTDAQIPGCSNWPGSSMPRASTIGRSMPRGTSSHPRRAVAAKAWEKHVVNTGMALKAYALAWRLTRREEPHPRHPDARHP